MRGCVHEQLNWKQAWTMNLVGYEMSTVVG
jgi:hypothetical protein